MKTCKGCGEAKPLEDFYRHHSNRDGRVGKCKSCAVKVAVIVKRNARKAARERARGNA